MEQVSKITINDETREIVDNGARQEVMDLALKTEADLEELLTRLTAARASALDRIGIADQAADSTTAAAITLHQRLRNVMDTVGQRNAVAGTAATSSIMDKIDAIIARIGTTGEGVRSNVSVQRGTTGISMPGGPSTIEVAVTSVPLNRTVCSISGNSNSRTSVHLTNQTTLLVYSDTSFGITWQILTFL